MANPAPGQGRARGRVQAPIQARSRCAAKRDLSPRARGRASKGGRDGTRGFGAVMGRCCAVSALLQSSGLTSTTTTGRTCASPKWKPTAKRSERPSSARSRSWLKVGQAPRLLQRAPSLHWCLCRCPLCAAASENPYKRVFELIGVCAGQPCSRSARVTLGGLPLLAPPHSCPALGFSPQQDYPAGTGTAGADTTRMHSLLVSLKARGMAMP